jgi:hypothetical protein
LPCPGGVVESVGVGDDETGGDELVGGLELAD